MDILEGGSRVQARHQCTAVPVLSTVLRTLTVGLHIALYETHPQIGGVIRSFESNLYRLGLQG